MSKRFDRADDFYKDIGVDLKGRDPRTIDESEIKAAFRRMTSQWHETKFVGKPDAECAAAEAMMKKINAAKAVLLDDAAVRNAYHDHLSGRLHFGINSGAAGAHNPRPASGSTRGGAGPFSGFGSDGKRFRTVEEILRELEEELAREEAERAARRAARTGFSPPPPRPASSGVGGGGLGSSSARSMQSGAGLGKIGVVIAGVFAAVAVGYTIYRKEKEKIEVDKNKPWAARSQIPNPSGRAF